MKEPRQRDVVRAGDSRRGERRAYLTEDLRFANHHRFDAGSDAEEMPRRLLASEHEERRALDRWLTLDFAQQPHDRARIADCARRRDIYLRTVTRRKHRRRRIASAQPRERLRQLARAKREVFPNRHRRRLVRDADERDLHATHGRRQSRPCPNRRADLPTGAAALPRSGVAPVARAAARRWRVATYRFRS